MFIINCLLVFTLMFITDVVWAFYIKLISDKKAFLSSVCGVLIYYFGSLVTLKWIEDSRYLIPAMAGAFFGTYITVKVMK